MSSRSRTRTARDVDVQSQWTNRQGLDRLARPRSLCTQQFQILAVLHPHGPLSLSATARKRAKHRRAQPCWGSELPACQAAGRTAAHPAAPYPTPRSRPPLLCPLLIGPPASRLPFYLHPSRSTRHHNQLRLGRSGPKSGDHGLALRPLRLVACYAMVGVRVSSAAATEERLTAGSFRSVGKPSGTARRGGEPTPIMKSTKRAFNRACQRANQALDGGTWYRGKWHTQQTLASPRYPNPAPILRTTTAARPRKQRARPDPNLSLLVWNTGGELHAARVHGVV